jgi:chemotaxis protein methyltransferase CheR
MGSNEEGISSRDYARLRDLVYREAGIHLGSDKKTMLEVRIKRRLLALDLGSYAQYCDYLFGPQGRTDEIVPFINVVTTNKTDFFREPRHFEFLAEEALPELTARNGNQLLIWSAGCSTGEEPYTLAMVLSEHAQAHPGFRFRVLATDISTTVLERAERGVYTDEGIGPVPEAMKHKYFMRSRNRDSNRVRVVPELRQLVEFRRLNFMEDDYGLAEKADAIFCRNVIIYFDRPTQERILVKLTHYLAPHGYMFVGHAETLRDMNLPLVPVAPALYRRVDARD